MRQTMQSQPQRRLSRILTAGLMAGTVAFSTLAGAPVFAQNDKMTPIAVPAQPNAIVLNTGPAAAAAVPDATAQESWHSQYGSVFARNVTVATLTPFLPPKGTATGAAVIVAPGGGFRSLSMENEGWDVAKALNKHGVAVFVLKYRLHQTPAGLDEFQKSMTGMVASGRPRPGSENPAVQLAPQIADARAAFALVRSRAREWNVDADRIGMLGFSAGARLTLATTLYGEDAKPAFIGNIYGALSAVDAPADAPPLFIAFAADDTLVASGGYGLVDSWKAARRPVEFHMYEQGGHGFGMYQKATTSTGWFDAFVRWIGMHGYLKPKAK